MAYRPYVRNTSSGSGTTGLTVSHTINGFADRLLLAFVYVEGNTGVPAISGVTYNGSAMTLVTSSAITGTYIRIAIYYMLQASLPSAGAYNIIVTASGGGGVYTCIGGGLCFSNVDQSAPFGTAGTASGTSTGPTKSIGSAVDDIVCSIVGVDNSNTSATCDASQTSVFSVTRSAFDRAAASYESAAGASTTSSYTLGTSQPWLISGVAVKGKLVADAGGMFAWWYELLEQLNNFVRKLNPPAGLEF